MQRCPVTATHCTKNANSVLLTLIKGGVLAEEGLELLSTEGVLTVLCTTLRAAHMSIACRLDALVSCLTITQSTLCTSLKQVLLLL
jgi:hypothetical protein